MNKFFAILKLFFNIFLFLIYAFFAIIIGDFIYGAFVTFVLNSDVASSTDPVHFKIAFISVLFTLVFTLIFRKAFYLEVFSDEIFKENTKKEDAEIYVNKEIK